MILVIAPSPESSKPAVLNRVLAFIFKGPYWAFLFLYCQFLYQPTYIQVFLALNSLQPVPKLSIYLLVR